ncbi:CHAP domain-containing protein [Verrucomicrobiota bacterium sgz303538]
MNFPRTQKLASRQFLAEVARREALLGREGDSNMAGPAIEPYLSTLREALNLNCECTKFSDLATGFNWCCAFVYYCCLHAGFQFPPKPVATFRYTLAAVPAWHHWALAEGIFQPGSTTQPQEGDIALYNRVFDGQPLDHIGVVVEVAPGAVLSAEGNNANRTGLFPRAFSTIEGYVRLPENA